MASVLRVATVTHPALVPESTIAGASGGAPRKSAGAANPIERADALNAMSPLVGMHPVTPITGASYGDFPLATSQRYSGGTTTETRRSSRRS